MTNVTDLGSRRPKQPEPPVVDGEREHIFDYRTADGVLKQITVWGKDEADARDQLKRGSEGEFIGLLYKRIPAGDDLT